MDVTTWEMAIRLLLALVLGAAVGADREALKKPAGLRTMMMVSLGAASFTLVAVATVYRFHEALDTTAAETVLRVDPNRIVSGIIGGIGFIGAGAIIQSGGNVKGITTAAGIWVTAAIGVAVGLGEYILAVMTTVAAVGVLFAMRYVNPVNGMESTGEKGTEDAGE